MGLSWDVEIATTTGNCYRMSIGSISQSHMSKNIQVLNLQYAYMSGDFQNLKKLCVLRYFKIKFSIFAPVFEGPVRLQIVSN